MGDFFSTATGAAFGDPSSIWGDVLQGARDIFSDWTDYKSAKTDRKFQQDLLSTFTASQGQLSGFSGATKATDSFAANIDYQAWGLGLAAVGVAITIWAVFFKK